MPNQTGLSFFHYTFPGAPNSDLLSDQILVGGPDADRGNIIAHSTASAIYLEDDGVRVSMRRNTYFCNGSSISFFEGPNFQKAPPLIQKADIFQISGTAEAGDTVEIIMNDTLSCPTPAACQGRIFLGEVVADDAGAWSLEAFPFPLLGGEQVTAIATNSHPVSSPFAHCATVVCPEQYATFSATRCANDSLLVHDQVFTVDHPSGEVVLVDSSSIGCDSIVSVTVHFLPLPTGSFAGTYCSNETLTIGGQTFDANQPEGTALIPGAAANGCDSLVDVALTFLQAPVTPIEATLCEGDSLAFCGTLITAPGTYFCELASAQGCDSTVLLNVQEALPSVAFLDTVLCSGQTLEIAGNSFSQAGPYEVLLQSAEGCDSQLQIELAYAATAPPGFEAVPDFGGGTGRISTTLGDSTLRFSWADGATTLERSGLDSGTYLLLLENSRGCISEWPVEVPGGTFKLAMPNTFTPNGDGQNDTFAPLVNTDQYQVLQFHIYNRWGQLVFRASESVTAWDGRFNSTPQPAEVYYYQLLISPGNGRPITVHGDVTLIR